MPLSSGTRLGPYKIIGQLGAGGMGEVYCAVDTRLERTVSIKVLPEHLGGDRERRARFEREARAVSSLNHQHICALYDVGEQDGTYFLVMEYLEGESLQQRLRKGRLPVDEAMSYAIQICDALDKAHREGVIHRDVKPGNIMLTASGVKLLDFGLAKLKTSAVMEPSLSQMTTHDALTREGTIVGTLQYMAPEQLEGQDADARSDIFAFGSVVYEMVTGRKAFVGASQASLIAAIMNSQPQPMGELEKMTPILDHVVRRCLAKRPDDRWQSARDAAEELRFAAANHAVPSRGPEVESILTDRRAWILVGVLALALVASLIVNLRFVFSPPSAPERAEVRFQIDTPSGSNPLQLALSPDGRQIAYAGPGGDNEMWIRRLDSLEERALPGTVAPGGAAYPFWSPDGRFVAFRAGPELKKADVTSGTVETIARGEGPSRGGNWGPDGTILFARDVIYSVPSTGGDPVPVTRLDTSLGEIAHSRPQYLPDGRHFLFKVTAMDPRNRGVFIGSLDPKEPRVRLLEASRATYVEPGFVVYARGQTLYARPFDAARREFTDQEVQLVDGVFYSETLDTVAFEVSNEGTLIFRSASTQPRAPVPLTWLNRSGLGAAPLGLTVEPGPFRLSPDGSRIAFERGTPPDIWIVDINRKLTSRLTSDRDVDHAPIWSPDGSSVLFDSHRNGTRGIYQAPVNGAVPEDLVFEAGANHVQVTDWSKDGQFVVFQRDSCVGCSYDIWVLPLSGDRQPRPYVDKASDERGGVLSPDSRWMAYQTSESGVTQVVVQPFPDPSGGKWPISTNGGTGPRWGSEGKELFYRDSDGRIVAVEVLAGATFKTGNSRRISQTSALWDMTSDGSRILTTLREDDSPSVSPAVDTASFPITVILNWRSLFESRRPAP